MCFFCIKMSFKKLIGQNMFPLPLGNLAPRAKLALYHLSSSGRLGKDFRAFRGALGGSFFLVEGAAGGRSGWWRQFHWENFVGEGDLGWDGWWNYLSHYRGRAWLAPVSRGRVWARACGGSLGVEGFCGQKWGPVFRPSGLVALPRSPGPA